MRVVVGSFVMTEPAQGFDYRVLRFGLAGVDHVINFGDIPEMGMIFLAPHRRNPTVVRVGIAVELAIAEIPSEQAELPHVVCDVFADIAHRAVRADDDFLIFLGNTIRTLLRLLYVRGALSD